MVLSLTPVLNLLNVVLNNEQTNAQSNSTQEYSQDSEVSCIKMFGNERLNNEQSYMCHIPTVSLYCNVLR